MVLKFGGKWTEENRKNNNYAALGMSGATSATAATRSPATTPRPASPPSPPSGNWANLGLHRRNIPFETGTTNALTFTNSAGVTVNLPRADRKLIGELLPVAARRGLVRSATVDNYYTAFIGNRRNFRQTVNAGYAQLDVNPLPRLTVRGGLRRRADREPLPRNTTRACCREILSRSVSP